MSLTPGPALGRPASDAAAFSRLGLRDTERARALLTELAEAGLTMRAGGPRVAALAEVGDPDAALLGLARLSATPAGPALVALADDAEGWARLLGVLGGSLALTDHLMRHPHDLDVFSEPAAPAPVRDFLIDPTAPNAIDAMRAAYRRGLLRVAAWDLASAQPQAIFSEVAMRLADLAGAALRAGLEIARARQPEAAAACRLAVIAMGKLGGRELNYLSDVDVIYVAEPADGVAESEAMHAGQRLADELAKAVSAPGTEPALWQLDANLRPEGRNGPLVRTLASHEAYLDKWAKTWEFQALLKARPIAGDRDLGAAYAQLVAPYVWRAVERENFVTHAQAMRARVEQHVPPAQADRQLKLGPGGLRDVEFSVQLLQLVHGRLDATLRERGTLDGLAALARGGYVSRSDAAKLAESYRFLRVLEHRIQLYRMRRTHLMPTVEADLRRLARSARVGAGNPHQLERAWRGAKRTVRTLQQELFYRPILPETAKLTADEAVLAPEAATARLRALGYHDPAGAVRHIAALTDGVSRRAAIQRQLLPVMLGWFAEGVDADAGLLAFRRLSDALGNTPWYLRMLRDSGVAGERLAHTLATSRYVAELLTAAPGSVEWFGADSDLARRSGPELAHEATAIVDRHDSLERVATGIAGLRRRELTRLAIGRVAGLEPAGATRLGVGDLAEASIAACLAAVRRELDPQGGLGLALIAMGSLGAREMGMASDADVIVVHAARRGDDEAAAQALATDIAKRLREVLGSLGPQASLSLDTDLRPEGRQGPLSRSLEAYRSYYERWALGWERQALLRARPLAGDADLMEAFVALIDPVRYPADGVDPAEVRELKRMKARVEAERLGRGPDAPRHLKLGPGTMSDAEWVAQLLQLRHAGADARLRDNTSEAVPPDDARGAKDVAGQGLTTRVLRAAAQAGHLTASDAETLVTAWQRAASARDAVMLWTAKRGPSTQMLPRDRVALSAISRILGYGAGAASEFEEDFLRGARRARTVFDKVFAVGS